MITFCSSASHIWVYIHKHTSQGSSLIKGITASWKCSYIIEAINSLATNFLWTFERTRNTWFWHRVGHGLRHFIVYELHTLAGKEANLGRVSSEMDRGRWEKTQLEHLWQTRKGSIKMSYWNSVAPFPCCVLHALCCCLHITLPIYCAGP